MLFPFCILLASVAHLHGAASSLRSITYSYNTKSYFSLQHLLLVEKRYSTLIYVEFKAPEFYSWE